jgi:tRNA(Ile)-lysidine synthase
VIDQFREHLRTSGLIPEGARVLVGYSGGADSTCLLHMMRLAGVDVVAGHLHHGQREEAAMEMKLAEAFCQELGVPFAGGRADIPRMATDLRMGPEEAGRHARYEFFNQAAFRLECQLIATAHTRSDDVETILLNMARGCGLAGLSGIPERRGNIIRPLLPFTREQTRDYCEERGLWFHNDPSNDDVSFSRARIRHRVLAELRLINPSVQAAIARLSEIATEEDRFLNGMAAAALEQTEIPLNGELAFLTKDCEAAFDRSALSTLPPVLFKRGTRLAVEVLGGNLSFEQTNALQAGVASHERGSVTADGGQVAVSWDSAQIHFRQLLPDSPFRYGLTVPGETISDEFGWKFTAFEAPVEESAQRRATLDVQMDKSKIRGQLYFRTAKAGDEMQPLGFSGHRKLSDLLSEAGLTQSARTRLPVVCDMVGPIWAPGVCLDERMRLTQDATSSIVMRFGPV